MCCDAPCFQPITALRCTSCFGGSPCDVLDVSDHVEARGNFTAALKRLPAHSPTQLERLSPPVVFEKHKQSSQTCQREVRPPGAGISRPSGGSPSTILLTCPRTTPRLPGGPCSAPRQEVLLGLELEKTLNHLRNYNKAGNRRNKTLRNVMTQGQVKGL